VGDLRRLFVAVDLGNEARHRLAAVIAAGLPILPGAVVPPANWHITLRFVGSASAAEEDRLLFALSEIDSEGPFELRLGRLGAFPRAAKATVLWLGIEEGQEHLASLAHQVEEHIQAAGFSAEDRPFRGHLTLSRLRPASDVRSILDDGFNAGMTVPVGDIVVFASILGRGGTRYEAVDRFAL